MGGGVVVVEHQQDEDIDKEGNALQWGGRRVYSSCEVAEVRISSTRTSVFFVASVSVGRLP